ncbi:MAG: cobalt-precorrin-5B (C(1))-methyltransferase [Deltaproteobacteria bacterium]|nr:cobalt-precorrin-5B (C(1))-methyltransferase [Deltaproteobacteria bacterium]MBW2020139.1 cobalt-precorrin-5B (C(1))-methyltransferase [Deltaproteobacteria bacterium]MBW2075740.1 cobalt-precorrin-5B (C(1))-methyltransferase [Deltaproteobacteria bacterium]RLB81632.1 MAG: hypothetical protein DRH17_08450 [Deltaproteobacteria bacterium]
MKPKRYLKSGFTTGTAAAAKAALMLLMAGQAPDSVKVTLPGGEKLKIPVHGCRLVGEKLVFHYAERLKTLVYMKCHLIWEQ